jgi:succinoglycan biosynthesis protein ExoA
MSLAKVSAVVVVRGEPSRRLDRMVDALAAQEGSPAIELVVAAPPEDHEALSALPARGAVTSISLVDNAGGGRSAGLNRAVAAARGDVAVRVDARSAPPPHYVAACLQRLEQHPRIGVVGGAQRPSVSSGGLTERAIARALANPWLLGGARYRRGAGGPADTVYLGVFRTAELREIGGFDEHLDANEDFELCARYRDRGFTVWVEPGLDVAYEPRDTFVGVWRQYFAFGRSKVRFWRRTRRRPNTRQCVALTAGVATCATLAGTIARGRTTTALAIGGAALGALAAVDHVAAPHERDARVRLGAIAASTCVTAAWLGGVISELVVPQGDRC